MHTLSCALKINDSDFHKYLISINIWLSWYFVSMCHSRSSYRIILRRFISWFEILKIMLIEIVKLWVEHKNGVNKVVSWKNWQIELRIDILIFCLNYTITLAFLKDINNNAVNHNAVFIRISFKRGIWLICSICFF